MKNQNDFFEVRHFNRVEIETVIDAKCDEFLKSWTRDTDRDNPAFEYFLEQAPFLLRNEWYHLADCGSKRHMDELSSTMISFLLYLKQTLPPKFKLVFNIPDVQPGINNQLNRLSEQQCVIGKRTTSTSKSVDKEGLTSMSLNFERVRITDTGNGYHKEQSLAEEFARRIQYNDANIMRIISGFSNTAYRIDPDPQKQSDFKNPIMLTFFDDRVFAQPLWSPESLELKNKFRSPKM